LNISIFGLGYVGCVSLGCLAKEGHHVIGVDVNKIKVDQINSGKPTIMENGLDEILKEQFQNKRIRATTSSREAVLHTQISIIAVSTPTTQKGHLDLNYIFNVADELGEAIKEKDEFHIIAIRSTIMPGTCNKVAQRIEEISGKKRNLSFAVLSNPEFLREGVAVHDYFNPPLTLIGTENAGATEKLASLYENLPAEIIVTDLAVAEIMKLINNTYHAMKVSFANEIGNICKALSIDSHKVMEIFIKDHHLNISPYYLKPGFAYGGSCLPKDLKGLQTIAHDHYLRVPLIESIDKTNLVQIERVVEFLSGYHDKRIGVLGLSFKAGTDDLRSSPTVILVETLLGKGYKLKIFDRNVQLSQLTGTNKEYIDYHVPHLSSLMVMNHEDLIKDSEVLVVSTKETEFVQMLRGIDSQLIVDLVHLDDDEILSKKNYYGINW